MNIIGMRFADLQEVKNEIEQSTGKKVYEIVDEGTTEASAEFGTDFEILVEFEQEEQHTLFYLKDNSGNYYITETTFDRRSNNVQA